MARSNYDLGAARAEQTAKLKRAILIAAVKLLAKHGPEGLNLRELGAAVGATTKVIYSHFGGKPGVVAAVYAMGFAQIAAKMEAAAAVARTPKRKLTAAAHAYRDFARANAALFQLMYGPAVQDLAATEADRAAAAPSLQVLVDAYGALTGENAKARDAARQFWTAIHGPVALEVSGWLFPEEAARRFEIAVERALEE